MYIIKLCGKYNSVQKYNCSKICYEHREPNSERFAFEPSYFEMVLLWLHQISTASTRLHNMDTV